MKLHRLLLSLALLGLSIASHAQWQWLDKDGQKVFSDRAPPFEVPEKDIIKRPNAPAKPSAPTVAAAAETPAPAASAPPRPPMSGVDKELEAKKKQMADAEAAKRKAAEDAVAKARAENCAQAKLAKAQLDSGVRLSRTNAKGEREFLDDTARAAEQKRIQSAIESECR
jgi:hypothetical protein